MLECTRVMDCSWVTECARMLEYTGVCWIVRVLYCVVVCWGVLESWNSRVCWSAQFSWSAELCWSAGVCWTAGVCRNVWCMLEYVKVKGEYIYPLPLRKKMVILHFKLKGSMNVFNCRQVKEDIRAPPLNGDFLLQSPNMLPIYNPCNKRKSTKAMSISLT